MPRLSKLKREKRPRPYIPLEVRCLVAARQCGCFTDPAARVESDHHLAGGIGFARLLSEILLPIVARRLGCEVAQLQLDHDPALGLRAYNPRIKDVAARYTPNANDPDFMIYRVDTQHLDKTAGRGGDKMRFGGDVRAMTKARALQAEPEKWTSKAPGVERLKKRRRRKREKRSKPIPSRPLRSRGFQRRAK